MKAFRKKTILRTAAVFASVLLFTLSLYTIVRLRFPRPYFSVVAASGVNSALVYSVMKAESGFRENAVSDAGALGLMQLMPSTALFVCETERISFSPDRLLIGEYNVTIGCHYLKYLLEKFSVEETAIAAYNAGEGVVRSWLNDPQYSHDRKHLYSIPYAETARYVKKIEKFRKIYCFLYH